MDLKKRLKYKTTTDSIAPSCIAIVNNLTNGVAFIPKIAVPIIMWPVEEIGKNSVKPSITAIINASKYVIK